MIRYVILFQSLFHLLASCPDLCNCQNGIVTCVQSLLGFVPAGIPPSTRVLNLNNNRIQGLSELCLKDLYNLEELYIEGNHLTSIHRGTFRNNVRLKVLSVRNNDLKELSELLFDGNRLIERIDVSNNPQLTVIPQQIIQNKFLLQSLRANNINCDCDMKDWLDTSNYYPSHIITQIDLTCFNPRNLRGYNLMSLPEGQFDSCSNNICAAGELLCDGDKCVAEEDVCDDNFDCFDGKDEDDCWFPKEVVCEDAEFACGMECVPNTWVCDGYSDCSDQSDEMNCPNSTDRELPRCKKQFECANTRCVDLTLKCDGNNDCGDWSDETKLMCGDAENVCPSGWMCGTEGCLDHTQICDGFPDCPDASDELNCYENCTSKCVSNGRCIKDSWVCDTVLDCPDGSDEANCDYSCGEDEVKCQSGGCVSCNFVCDEYNDCIDHIDETFCSICNGSLCMEMKQTKSGVTTIVIIATTVSACISITSVILFVVVYRQRRKSTAAAAASVASRLALQPPLYTEIDHSHREYIPGSPPPRYKSEPDIAAQLTSVEAMPLDDHHAPYRSAGEDV